jgi:hypothetical protein
MEIFAELLLKIKYCVRVVEIHVRTCLKIKYRNKIQQGANIAEFLKILT